MGIHNYLLTWASFASKNIKNVKCVGQPKGTVWEPKGTVWQPKGTVWELVFHLSGPSSNELRFCSATDVGLRVK